MLMVQNSKGTIERTAKRRSPPHAEREPLPPRGTSVVSFLCVLGVICTQASVQEYGLYFPSREGDSLAFGDHCKFTCGCKNRQRPPLSFTQIPPKGTPRVTNVLLVLLCCSDRDNVCWVALAPACYSFGGREVLRSRRWRIWGLWRLAGAQFWITDGRLLPTWQKG